MKITKSKMTLAELHKVRNYRLLSNEGDISSLLNDVDGIPVRGLLEPLKVLADGEILQGHRRVEALRHISTAMPEVFARWFKNGIPVEIVSDATANEIESLRADHGKQKGLQAKMEFVSLCVALSNNGHKERDILFQNLNLFDYFSPKADATLKAEYSKLIKENKLVPAYDIMKKCYHGTFQTVNRYYTLPEICFHVAMANANGEKTLAPDVLSAKNNQWIIALGIDIPVLPNLVNAGNMKDLDVAFRADLSEKDTSNISKYSKYSPGPKFIAKFVELLTQAADETPATKRDKAIPAGELLKHAGDCQSIGMKDVFLYCAGKPANIPWKQTDLDCLLVEVIKPDTRNIVQVLLALQNAIADNETNNDINEYTLIEIIELAQNLILKSKINLENNVPLNSERHSILGIDGSIEIATMEKIN